MVTIIYHGEKKQIEGSEGRSVLELVRDNFSCTFSPCARPGSCGRCRCVLKSGETALACRTFPEDGDEIECRFEESDSKLVSLHKAKSTQNVAGEYDLHNTEQIRVSGDKDSLHNTECISAGDGKDCLHNAERISTGDDKESLHNIDLHNVVLSGKGKLTSLDNFSQNKHEDSLRNLDNISKYTENNTKVYISENIGADTKGYISSSDIGTTAKGYISPSDIGTASKGYISTADSGIAANGYISSSDMGTVDKVYISHEDSGIAANGYISSSDMGTADKVYISHDNETAARDCISEGFDADSTGYITVDIGTTTIAMSYDGRSMTCVNPQRPYGADVPSRIRMANEGKAGELERLMRECLLEGFRKLDPKGCAAGALISGNTTMLHLLLGYDCSRLGRAPFTPYSLKVAKAELGGYPVFTLPGISAFVGADIVSGLYYVEEEFAGRNEDYLFLDLGTNGEMAARYKGRYFCTSAAAGPAFEGMASAGVFGADLIHAVALGLREGAIDSTGLLRDEYFEDGYRVSDGIEFTLTQKMIREIQLAKAAVRCGLNELSGRCGGFDSFDKIYIAGGMGYFTNGEDAVRIGLLPPGVRGKAEGVGNSSLAGAERLASYLVQNMREAKGDGRASSQTAGHMPGDGDAGFVKNEALAADIVLRYIDERLGRITENAEVLQLPELDSFGDEYIAALDFPE